MKVTKIEYRGAGFYAGRPTRIVREEWRPRTPWGVDDDWTGPVGLHPLRPDEVPELRLRPRGGGR